MIGHKPITLGNLTHAHARQKTLGNKLTFNVIWPFAATSRSRQDLHSIKRIQIALRLYIHKKLHWEINIPEKIMDETN